MVEKFIRISNQHTIYSYCATHTEYTIQFTTLWKMYMIADLFNLSNVEGINKHGERKMAPCAHMLERNGCKQCYTWIKMIFNLYCN